MIEEVKYGSVSPVKTLQARIGSTLILSRKILEKEKVRLTREHLEDHLNKLQVTQWQ